MHMADALISPAVGGIMLAATTGVAAYSVKKIKDELDEKRIPLMGVMGAFVFAAQMINFTIPGTGSSGHLGGGMILAALLGPYAGFLTMASVLLIQALFFGDGGLLALGSNVFNLGFFTCFVAYPLIFKRISRNGITSKRIFTASLISALVSLQLGSFGVVLETVFSGKTELPFGTFVFLMQPIHLAIGVVEGLVTAAILTFIWRARPEILDYAAAGVAMGNIAVKKLVTMMVIASIIIGASLSWFASTNPDGLEWSVSKITGNLGVENSDGIHTLLANIQKTTAFLPKYGFKVTNSAAKNDLSAVGEAAWPAASAGKSVSGLVGGALTLFFAMLIGFIIYFLKKRSKKSPA